jgi:hypothetical protein
VRLVVTDELSWCCGVVDLIEDDYGQSLSYFLSSRHASRPMFVLHGGSKPPTATGDDRELQVLSPTSFILWPSRNVLYYESPLPETGPPNKFKLEGLIWGHNKGSFVCNLLLTENYSGPRTRVDKTPPGAVCVLSAGQLWTTGHHFYDTNYWKLLRTWRNNGAGARLCAFQRQPKGN